MLSKTAEQLYETRILLQHYSINCERMISLLDRFGKNQNRKVFIYLFFLQKFPALNIYFFIQISKFQCPTIKKTSKSKL